MDSQIHAIQGYDMNELPTQQELLERYYYDAFSGRLFHKIKVSNVMGANTAVENMDKHGYLRTKIKGKSFKVHRIIWKMIYNEEPKIIDHINRIKNDNRIVNLRNVNERDNVLNKKLFDNRLVGAQELKRKNGSVYRMAFYSNGKRITKVYKTKEEAHRAYSKLREST